MTLYAQLLGSLRLTYEETAVSLPTRSHAKTLLAYLLLHPGQIHTRSQLAALLTPEASEEQARRTLSQALWHIRQSLPVPLLQTEGDRIYILPEVPLQIDVVQFNELVAPHLRHSRLNETGVTALTTAVSLYEGDLLNEFYDDWLLLRREQLREQYLQALWLLSGCEKENGRYQSALHHLLQLSQADPLREEVHREIMRCYALLNRPNAALRQYALYAQLLQNELQLDPEAATQQLRQEILTQRQTDSQPIVSAQTTALIGRQAERKLILQQLQNGKQQQGSLILLEGNAGSGKTHLCQTIIKDAQWREMRIVHGFSQQTQQTVPYHALITAIESLLTPLTVAQLQQQIEPVWLQLITPFLPALGTGQQPEISHLEATTAEHQQMRLQEAWLQLLVGWSRIAPLLIVLEDVHQLDEATRALLALFVHRLPTQRIVLLLNYRGNVARQNKVIWQWLQMLDETAVCQRITLNNLSATETAELVRLQLGLETAVPHFTDQLFTITGGNPLFVVETVHVLQESHDLTPNETENGTATWDDIALADFQLELPARVETAIAQRIAHLSAEAQQLLRITAVFNSTPSLQQLQAISPFSAQQTIIALNQLVQHKFLSEHPDHYTFSHQLMQQVAYAQLTQTEKQQAHSHIVHVLSQINPENVSALAYHATQAQETAVAITYHLQAAQQAKQQFTLTTAKTHLDEAINLLLNNAVSTEIPQQTQFNLFAEREAIAHVLGDTDSCQHDLHHMQSLAAQSARQQIETEKRWARFYTATAQADYDLAINHVQNALDMAQQQANQSEIAAVHALWGHICVMRGDNLVALAQFETALDYHQTLDEPAAHAQILLDQAIAQRTAGQHHVALDSVQKALALFVTSGDKMAQANALAELAVLNHEQGHSEAATAYYQQTLQLCRDIGYRYREAVALVNWGNLLWFQGQVNQTIAHYEAASMIFSELGSTHAEAQLKSNLASILTTLFGQFTEARVHAEWALAQFQHIEDWIGVGQALATLGAIAQEEGKATDAEAYLRESMAALSQVEGTNYIFVMCLRMMALVKLEQNQPEKALETVDEALAICTESGMSDLQVTLSAIRGLALLALNRSAEAVEIIETAVSAIQESVDQDYLVWWWYAQILTAVQRQEEAAAAAHQAYTRLLTYVAPLTAAQQEQSLSVIGDHAAIVAQWRSAYQQIDVALPHTDAPTGRPLRDDEVVQVKWTVQMITDTAVSNKKERRQTQILRLLDEASAQHAAPTIQDLASALAVSPGTIKRDLAALRQAGHEINTRGS